MGYKEDETSWRELFLDVRETRRELKTASLRVFLYHERRDPKIMTFVKDKGKGLGDVNTLASGGKETSQKEERNGRQR